MWLHVASATSCIDRSDSYLGKLVAVRIGHDDAVGRNEKVALTILLEQREDEECTTDYLEPWTGLDKL